MNEKLLNTVCKTKKLMHELYVVRLKEEIYFNCIQRGIAINHLMKKSSTKSDPKEEALQKQGKENVLRMATVVRSEPPAFISPKTNKQVPYEDYRLELEAWILSTDVEKKKQAVLLQQDHCLSFSMVSNYEIR